MLPAISTLPPLPPSIPAQAAPFRIPSTLEDTIACLTKPLQSNLGLANPPKMPSSAESAHPFIGGETNGHDRIKHLVTSGSMTTYHETRNGTLGLDFSTKLSAWLALGCVSARQIHQYLLDFEEARSDLGKGVQGYGQGENRGTAAVRFELLWRDYFRLATRKFGSRLFHIGGFKTDTSYPWKHPQGDEEVQHKVSRFLEGTTGTGFIDASMRELFLTGYTSNRLRQNVASFLAKHLGIDWRIGAEWYESMLCDYDLSSNWGNWQYNAGVGNDPREARVFNPVKQVYQALLLFASSPHDACIALACRTFPCSFRTDPNSIRRMIMIPQGRTSRIGSPNSDPSTTCRPFFSRGGYLTLRSVSWAFKGTNGWSSH